MDAAAWLAQFRAADDTFRHNQVRLYREIGSRLVAERAPKAVKAPLIGMTLEAGRVVDPEESDVPGAVRSHWNAAMAVGWGVKVVRALGAVPAVGLVETWSLRCARHDERLIAVWWITTKDGRASCSYNLGIYQGPAAIGVEQLGVETLDSRVRAITKAVREGRVDRKTGLPAIPGPLQRRGLLDAINGIRLPS